MKQNNINLKHRIMAVVITLSVLLSYFSVYITDSFAYDGAGAPVVIGSVVTDWRGTDGKVTKTTCYIAKTSVFTSQYELIKNFCVYDNGISSGGYNISFVDKPSVDGKPDLWTYVYSADQGLSGASGWSNIACDSYSITGCYQFKDLATCRKYLNGQMSDTELATAALNYKEVQDSLASYDSSIPVPIKGNVNVITVSTVSSIFNYDENEIKQFEEEHGVTLQYDYEVEYFYQLLTKSQINKKNSNLEVAEVNRGVDDFALDKNNLMVAKTTCKEQFEAFQVGGTPTTQKYLCTADSGTYKTSGAVELSNAVTSSPPDYYTIYSIPFSVFSMEYHMQFIVAQVRVTTYYIDDSGLKHTSDDVYFRRCLWDEDNDHYGATYTRIAKDESGNDVFKNSYEMNANGDNISNDLGNIDDSNLLEHIKNGFGLFGTDGYVALAQRFFLGVPNQIWSLIYMAMAVSIILIVFKTMRGN